MEREIKFEIKLKAREPINGYKIGETVIIVNPIFDRNIGIAFFPIGKNYDIVYQRQSTGLMSSDAGCGLPVKDAYFGDIIRFYNTDGKEINAEIIYYKEEECIGFRRLSDGYVYTQAIFNNSGYFQPSKIQFQIIGNNYENPELLTNTNT